MEKVFAKAEELADVVKQYADTKMDEVKLNVAEKTSAMAANMMAGLIVAIVFVLAFLFGSIALAILLGKWMDNMWLGFLVLAGFYLLLGMITWMARQRLIRLPLMNAMVRQLFKNDEDEED